MCRPVLRPGWRFDPFTAHPNHQTMTETNPTLTTLTREPAVAQFVERATIWLAQKGLADPKGTDEIDGEVEFELTNGHHVEAEVRVSPAVPCWLVTCSYDEETVIFGAHREASLNAVAATLALGASIVAPSPTDGRQTDSATQSVGGETA